MEKRKHEVPEGLNHLIVYCNPNPESLSAVYRDTLVEQTESAGHSVNVRDLYNIGFDPLLGDEDLQGDVVPEVELEQDYICLADLVTFIYPVWWGGMPAMMKGYIDRVFTKDFAFKIDANGEIKGELSGKKVVILNNMGAKYECYQKKGMLEAMEKVCKEGIFDLCGMEVVGHRFFGRMYDATDKEKMGHVETIRLIYNKLLPLRQWIK